jgi:dolichol-phosphate mannosyltransferase
MIIGGIQLIFIGMVGEYLARIFEESKRRPLYFFKQTPDDVDD